MPGNIFDQFDAPQQPASAPNPYVVQPNPMRVAQQQAEEERKRRDQMLQEEAAVREAERLRMSQQDQQRQVAKDAEGTQDERTAGFLTKRIVDSVGRISSAVQKDPSAARPPLGPEIVRSVLGDKAANYLTDAERQQARAAELDILDAALTLGTGAAYNREQLEGYRESYFPQLGDDESTIASKRRALRSLLVSASMKAGRAAPDIESAIAQLDAMNGGGGTPPQQQGESVQYSPVIPGGLTGSVTDDRPTSPTPPINGNSPGYAQIAAGVGDLVEGGLNSTVGLLANPLGQLLYNATGYGDYQANIGQGARNLLGLPEGDPTISAINQAAAGGLGVGSGARALSGLTSGVGQRALAEFGSRPIMDFIGGAGAGAGSELARASGGGPFAQALAAMAGGAGAGGLAGARSLGRGPRRPIDLDTAVVEAGQRQGIPIRRPDAVPSLRGDMATAEASAYGGPTVGRTLQRDQAAVESRLGQIGGPGTPLNQNFTLGERAQGVGRRYIERTRQQKNDKYAQAEQASQGQRIIPQNAIAEIDRNIAELTASGANTNSATISYLQGLRDDLAKGDGFSITEFQGLRSAASKKIKGDQALTVSDADRRLGNVVDAFTADAEDQLPQAATKALREADKFYAQRQDFIGTVLRGLLGSRGLPLPAERAAERLIAMTRNRADYQKFSRFYAEATPDEKADFAATIAESLGRGRNGEFSLGALATNIGKMPQNIRSTVFGKDGARALEDLRIIARAKSDTGSGLNNSRSGVVMARNIGGIAGRAASSAMAGGYAGGGTGAVIAPIATEIATALAQQRNARLLLNPDFTRWLRTMPNNPLAMGAHWNRLQQIAAKSPVIANDIEGLAALLNRPVNAAAASGEEREQDKQ